MKQRNTQNLSPRELQEQKYNISRANLLLVVGFTLLNVILALLGGNYYLLFSASIPYFIVYLSMYLCGKLPVEHYEGDIQDYYFLDDSLFIIATVLAFVIIAVYALFWWLSKEKKSGWLIAALVFFGIDTLGMFYFYGFSVDIIMNLLFHAWIIYYLVSGIVAAQKLKALPEEDEPAVNFDIQNGEFSVEATETDEHPAEDEQPAEDNSDTNA